MRIKYFAIAIAIVGIFVAALVVASGDPATGRAQEAEASSPMPQLYWVDAVAGKIQRTYRDEHTVVEDVVASGLVSPRSIALDVAAGKMYWTDSGERKIQRANLDGSGVEDLVTSEFGLLNPVSIALDLSARRMYWADRSVGRIQSASLDGSGAVTVVAGLHAPYQLALDVAGGKMYWTEYR